MKSMSLRLKEAATKLYDGSVPKDSRWWGAASVTTSRQQFDVCKGYVNWGYDKPDGVFHPKADKVEVDHSAFFLLLCAEAEKGK
jgi:hypothetical protein